MTWGPDDWSWWIRIERESYPGTPAPDQLLHEILRNVPGRRQKTIAHLGPAPAVRLQFLAGHFAHVVTVQPHACGEPGVEHHRQLRVAAGPYARPFHVVLAVDSLARPTTRELDRALESVRRNLVEGGLLVATFPAAPGETVACAMRLHGAPSRGRPLGLHEVELQYRLRRAGLRGVRMRRLPSEDGMLARGHETLLCTAVRRANN